MSDITQKKMEQIAQMWNARGKGLITHMGLEIEEVSIEGVRVRMPFIRARMLSSARIAFGKPAILPLIQAASGSMATRMRKSPVDPPRLP